MINNEWSNVSKQDIIQFSILEKQLKNWMITKEEYNKRKEKFNNLIK